MTRQTADLGGRGERPTFDYIVVGAGPAGCAVAARLAQSSADDERRPDRSGTGQGFAAVRHSARDRRAGAVPLAAATTPTRPFRRRGSAAARATSRAAGASAAASLINAMIYTRGQPQDYDSWAALGCKGWGWSDVLPYFKRSEDNARGADALHGVGGPLHVSDLSYRNPAVEAFVEAAVAGGISAQRRFQRRDPGRRRAVSGVPEERPPLQRRPRLSASRARAKSRDLLRLPGAAHPVRGPAGGRRRLSAAAARSERLYARREIIVVRRRLWLAAASDGVGRSVRPST